LGADVLGWLLSRQRGSQNIASLNKKIDTFTIFEENTLTRFYDNRKRVVVVTSKIMF